MFYLILIVPGLIAAYLMFLRPVLKAVPALQAFYAEADTIWQKIWAVCGKSLTLLWSYFLMAFGGLWSQVDSLATMLGDPNFKEQVNALIGADPKAIGYFAMIVSGITIAARLRSIAKG